MGNAGTTVRIGFTGHRDSITSSAELDKLRDAYPGAKWIHGGAVGFDQQVQRYAEKHGIEQEIVPPRYRFDGDRCAPLKRNLVIIYKADFLIACYDGRRSGGTYKTLQIAQLVGLQIYKISCFKVSDRPQTDLQPMTRIGDALQR